jgi:hypothetical protein
VCADVALVAEGLDAAPDADVLVQLEGGLAVFGLVGVYPLFDFCCSRAFVYFVGDVCGLGVYGADLTDEGDLSVGFVSLYVKGKWPGREITKREKKKK